MRSLQGSNFNVVTSMIVENHPVQNSCDFFFRGDDWNVSSGSSGTRVASATGCAAPAATAGAPWVETRLPGPAELFCTRQLSMER